jgi:glucose-fructose oxidoreductase
MAKLKGQYPERRKQTLPRPAQLVEYSRREPVAIVVSGREPSAPVIACVWIAELQISPCPMHTPHHPCAGQPVSRREFLGRVSLGAAAWLALGGRGGAAEPPARKLGVALVGLGYYSQYELGPALRQTQFCRLAGVVTGSAAKGRHWAGDYGFPEKNIYHYRNMARLADNPDIDIVYVVTPNALHAEHAMAAARAGKHVISEKPFTATVAQAAEALSAFRAAGIRHSIGYRLHFDPLHEELRRLARTKELGPFLKMKGEFAFVMGPPQWRAQKALAGGGPLMDLGIYVLQEACMAAGAAPVAVTARELPKRRPEFFRDVEESLEWTMEFADGARSTCYTSYNDSRDHFRAEAKDGWFELGPAYGYRGLKAATNRGRLKSAPFNQQAAQMDDFARCIMENRPTRVPGELGLRDMKIIEAIYQAAATGKRVVITV